MLINRSEWLDFGMEQEGKTDSCTIAKMENAEYDN